MKLYKLQHGAAVEIARSLYRLPSEDWDALLNREDLSRYLASAIKKIRPSTLVAATPNDILAPISKQEVWAAGVTYLRSRTARRAESEDSGGGSFYDRVYTAKRPELFFKSNPQSVAGHGEPVRIRRDSKWNVPEPELVAAVNARGKIIGYTIGNDVSSRDIEGENPLYLPQAKVYQRSCALGPGILLAESNLPRTTKIDLEILRAKKVVFRGDTTLAQLKRAPAKLVEFLYRENAFPHGCFLFTGTGIVPPDTFTLAPRDEVRISITGIGTLSNTVEQLAPKARP
ncbi:MAG: fumarylacetoacetate hydrolase family protein [Candidatus Acidiferrales bacterium]